MDRLSSEDSTDSEAAQIDTQKKTLLARTYQQTTRVGNAIWSWVEGPNPPEVLRINPLFPAIQTWPIRMRDRLLPKRRHKLAALAVVYFLWMTLFVLVTDLSRFRTWTDEQYGTTM